MTGGGLSQCAPISSRCRFQSIVLPLVALFGHATDECRISPVLLTKIACCLQHRDAKGNLLEMLCKLVVRTLVPHAQGVGRVRRRWAIQFESRGRTMICCLALAGFQVRIASALMIGHVKGSLVVEGPAVARRLGPGMHGHAPLVAVALGRCVGRGCGIGRDDQQVAVEVIDGGRLRYGNEPLAQVHGDGRRW